MSEENQQHEIARKTVVYKIPGADAVTVRRDVKYGVTDADALTMDIYQPPDWQKGARLPAVVFVVGYPDTGFQMRMGCKQKEMGSYISWAQLAAASGLMAITYTTTAPATDISTLLDYLHQHAAELGIDEHRLGLWACSGSVPNALSVLMHEDDWGVRCAVLCYGFMLDLDGASDVAEAAKQWGFVNPCAGKSVADLPQNLPLFIARAGQDQFPHLSEALDRFLAKALQGNLPITFVNHSTAPHAFDLFDDTEKTREIIRLILAFLRFHLMA